MTESTGLTPEDARIIAAAANDGRISPDNIDVWCNAMRADRDGTRKTLASIVSIKADLYTAEQVHAAVLGRLGITEPTKPRPVAAASPEAIANERAVLDAFGLPVADMPAPVLMRKGVNVEDYTQEQHFDRFLNMLGGRFKAYAKPLPQGDSWYLPSPNDTVEFKNGQWVEKNPYRELP